MSAENTNMIEDFVNVDDTMDVDQDTETEEKTISAAIKAKHDVIGIESPALKSVPLCVTLTGRALPEEDESKRAPVDIVVALDVSGSMQGRKLELCKETLSLLLRELGPRDRFGLVSFGSNANIEIPMRRLDKQSKESAMKKIENLRTSGCTNMSGGIGLAASELQAVESPNEVRAAFLLTDGHANEGVSDTKGIVQLTKGCLGTSKGQSPISLHCFGYGQDHNKDMLNEMSMCTEGGSYYFVNTDSDVSSAFGDALGGVLSVVVQNCTVKLSVPPEASELGVSIVAVKHDKAVKNLDGYEVTLGDFYAEEERDLIVEVTLASKGDGSAIIPHMVASLSYLDIINKKLVRDEKIIGSVGRPEGKEVSSANCHVALQCLRIKATEVMKQTESQANTNLASAKSNINEFINQLTTEAASLGESGNPLVVNLLSDLNAISAGLASRSTWKAASKEATSSLNSHVQQRCYTSKSDQMSCYRSPKKMEIATKFKFSQGS